MACRLNQWWNIFTWTLRKKVQWNFDRNSNIFIQENAFENVVCEMASILSRPQCVKTPGSSYVGIHVPHAEGVVWPILWMSSKVQNIQHIITLHALLFCALDLVMMTVLGIFVWVWYDAASKYNTWWRGKHVHAHYGWYCINAPNPPHPGGGLKIFIIILIYDSCRSPILVDLVRFEVIWT